MQANEMWQRNLGLYQPMALMGQGISLHNHELTTPPQGNSLLADTAFSLSS